MTNTNLVIEISKLKGRELHTLDRSNPFTVKDVTQQKVTLLLSQTGKERSIPLIEIEAAWQELVTKGELSRIQIHSDFSEFNPAYVAALLAELPGVTHQDKPIRLFYKQVSM